MLNLSGVSIGGNSRRGTQHQHHHHHGHHQQQHADPTRSGGMPPTSGAIGSPIGAPTYPDVSSAAATAGGATTASGGNSSVAETLFEEEAPIHLRNMDREEVCQDLGVCVQLTKNGPYRAIHVRVTDPKDPFFLYTMSLSEDDYGRFKERNELAVDFAGFPRDLVTMLSSAQGTPSLHNAHQHQHQHSQHAAVDSSTTSTAIGGPTLLTFHITDGVQGTLRILERTGFRLVEHLLLNMVRQGDVGQKQYLADRFRFFQHSYLASEQQRRVDVDRMGKQIADLSAALDEAKMERDGLRQEGAVQASEAKLALATTTEHMREAHDEQLRTLQAERDAQLDALAKAHAADKERAGKELAHTAQRLERAGQQVQDLEAERLRLSTELAQKSEALASATHEGQRLAERVEELSSFKRTASRERQELDMQAVASGERLKHMSELLKARDEEVSTLRRQNDSAEGNLRRSNEQLDSTRKKLDETEASLAKAHHIITTHLATLKSKQEKLRGMEAAVAAADKRAQEKQLDAERVRMETQADRDRCETLTARAKELKEQLQKAEDDNQKLGAELKQSQEALMHLGRSASSSMPSRTWSSHVPSGGGGGAGSTSMAGGGASMSTSSFAPAPISRFREFARGESGAGGGSGDMSQYGSTSTASAYGRPPMSASSSSYTPGAYSSSGMAAARTPGSGAAAGGGGGGVSVGGGSSDFKSMLRNTASASTTPAAPSAYFPNP